MRIVRWHPQERVDKPDLDAMSYLVLGEFRRTNRALIQGEQSYVVTGFAVEPQAVPDATVRVRMQPPGTERASALGAELTTAGLDKGQLIGDRDSSFINEGPAQQILDFSAQPVGSYTVELRFVYADAVNDNRAFWNPGGATEFVSNVQTRTVSSWEVQFVAGAPSGGQWIPLATVAWDGVAVDPVDITDLRTFLWEGVAPFQQTTQTGAGGVEDFARGTARADQATGLHRLRSFARGVLRQIQDIKGQNDAGLFDWFSRVFSPWDPADALGGQTKTMRTIDTVTYTVGDGVSVFGDFNGAGGLDACLAHVEAFAAANRPERVEIVLHGGTSGTAYTISTDYVIQGGLGNPITVVIRAGQTLAQANVGLFGRPRITMLGAGIAASNYGLLVTGTGLGSLVLRGLDVLWSGTTAGGRGMFAANGYIQVDDCNIQQTVAPASPDVGAGYVLLSSLAQKCSVRNSVIRGRIGFYNDPGDGSFPTEREMGCIEHCRLEEAQIVLHADTPGVPGVDSVNGFVIRDCSIVGRNTAIYTGSVALIDARCARRLRVLDCSFSYGVNENCIDLRTYNGESPFDAQVRGCRFDDTISNGTHAVGAGSGGANGTGWAINASDVTDYFARDNLFLLSAQIDAGGTRLHDVQHWSIDGESFRFCGHAAGGTNRFDGYLLTGTLTGSIFGKLAGIQFSDWNTGVTRVRCVNLDNCSRIAIGDSTFLGQEFGFGPALVPASGFGAMRVDAIQDVRVHNCLFEKWANATANSRTIFFTTTFQSLMVEACSFLDCGGYSIVNNAGLQLGVTIDDCNHWTGDGANENFADVRNCLSPRVTNCKGTVTAGSPNVLIIFDQNNFLFMGNLAPSSNIDADGSGATGRGFNEAGQDLNLVNAYVP